MNVAQQSLGNHFEKLFDFGLYPRIVGIERQLTKKGTQFNEQADCKLCIFDPVRVWNRENRALQVAPTGSAIQCGLD